MSIKLLLPQNIFSNLFLNELNPDSDVEIIYLPASLISKKLSEDENALGLIPSFDLLTFKDLYLSSRIGISFNALLSNAYLYFKENEQTLDQLSIAGDVTTNEIILLKILFREFYNIEIQPKLITSETFVPDGNFVLVGDKNFKDEQFMNGLSFSEEIIELINAPYINFALSGQSYKTLGSFINQYEKNFIDGHTDSLLKLNTGFSELSNDFIRINIQHVIFDFENQDIAGIKNLIQMPYYYGIINEMIDLKFV